MGGRRVETRVERIVSGDGAEIRVWATGNLVHIAMHTGGPLFLNEARALAKAIMDTVTEMEDREVK